MTDEVKARRELIARLRADMDEMVSIASVGVDECERLRELARALYSSWLEAYYQLDPLWQEKHGHNEELKKYEAPEYAWLTALDNDPTRPPISGAVEQNACQHFELAHGGRRCLRCDAKMDCQTCGFTACCCAPPTEGGTP